MSKKNSGIEDVVSVLPAALPKGKLGKLARKPRVVVPSVSDPVVELKRLTNMHKSWTKRAVAIENMSTDKKDRETNEVIKCNLPQDSILQMEEVVKGLKRQADSLKSGLRCQLREIPIYKEFLSKTFGAKGEVIAAYLVSSIDIHKAVKPSNLRRYCGMAVIDGALERRSGAPKEIGGTGTFNAELRTRLFQLFNSMWKNQRHDPNNKYLKIWKDYQNRIEHSDRIVDRGVEAKGPREGKWTGRLVNGRGKEVSGPGFAYSYGWHKACDVFLEDLYTVWRALEGLPVWPSYYAAKLGYGHGGKISVNAPRLLTLQEALDLAGVGSEEAADVEEDEDLSVAAE